MKKNSLVLVLSLFTLSSFAQINMADSSVQVISYWDKDEKQSYSVSLEKIKIKDSDTTSKELTTYDVDVTVLKASKKSYTVQWEYKNFKSSGDSKLAEDLFKLTKALKVIYTTDELGNFLEVVNWKEIRDYNSKAMAVLQKKYKDVPDIDKMIKQIEASFSTKEAIESVSIKDIKQFHSFHGAKYKLHEELNGKLEVPNILTNKPFDADFTVYLDEINEADNNYIIRSSQVVDSVQLTDATFQYLSNMSKTMKTALPKREEFKTLSNEIQVGSRIHGSGWVIYSIQTTTVNGGDQTNIEERIMEIK
ncbi:MAG: hypothetical protein MH472_04215 [Bacteroidia bacterium]|nr:hypothetical protein [Bacteroidia bacterium]